MVDPNPRPRPQIRPQVLRAARESAARTAHAVARGGYTVLPTREELDAVALLPTMRDAEQSGMSWALDGTMDVVWTVRPGDVNELLRHSMRSVAVQVPYAEAWVAGHAPPWVSPDEVGHLPVAQNGNPYENSTANLRAACSDSRVSDPFLWLHDDFFALRSIDAIPLVDKGKMAGLADRLFRRYRREYAYLTGLRGTLDLLRTMGHDDPICFEIHAPIVVHKEEMLDAIDRFAGVPAAHKRSAYGNLHLGAENSTTIDDVKIAFPSTPTHWPDSWVSTGSHSWNGATGQVVRKRYASPSRFER